MRTHKHFIVSNKQYTKKAAECLYWSVASYLTGAFLRVKINKAASNKAIVEDSVIALFGGTKEPAVKSELSVKFKVSVLHASTIPFLA